MVLYLEIETSVGIVITDQQDERSNGQQKNGQVMLDERTQRFSQHLRQVVEEVVQPVEVSDDDALAKSSKQEGKPCSVVVEQIQQVSSTLHDKE
jgi:hypothetical protein